MWISEGGKNIMHSHENQLPMGEWQKEKVQNPGKLHDSCMIE